MKSPGQLLLGNGECSFCTAWKMGKIWQRGVEKRPATEVGDKDDGSQGLHVTEM